MSGNEKVSKAPKSPPPKTIEPAREAELSGACKANFDCAVGDADADVSKVHKVDKGIESKKFDHHLRRITENGDNQTFIAINQTPDLDLTPAERKKKEDKAMNAALKLSRDIAKRIADLDSKIDDYDRKIRAIEKDIFTKEELLDFDKLSPAERFNKIHDEMKKKLASGDITQAQYDQWLLFNQEREAARIERDHVQSEFGKTKGLEGQEKVDALQKVVDENNIDAVRQERESLGQEAKEQVELAIEQKKDDGVIHKQEAQDTFDSFLDDTEMLGEASQPKSFASEIATNSGFQTKLCPIKTAFNTASQNCEELEKDVIVSVDKGFDAIKLS